jgi:hypothetical protein
MVSNLKGVDDESTERVGRGHMRKGRLCCATRKGMGESCRCESHTDHSVAPGNVKRSGLRPKTRRSDDTEAIGSGNRSQIDGNKHTDSH